MIANLSTPEGLKAQVNIAQTAFAILAEIKVFPATSVPDSTISELESEPNFAGTIRYIGNCQASLRIECSPSLAYAFTQRVCCIDAPQEFNSEVSDAIGELINTIGGNLKGLLPPQTRINIPEVFIQLPGAATRSAGSALSCLNFDSKFGAFRLILFDVP